MRCSHSFMSGRGRQARISPGQRSSPIQPSSLPLPLSLRLRLGSLLWRVTSAPAVRFYQRSTPHAPRPTSSYFVVVDHPSIHPSICIPFHFHSHSHSILIPSSFHPHSILIPSSFHPHSISRPDPLLRPADLPPSIRSTRLVLCPSALCNFTAAFAADAFLAGSAFDTAGGLESCSGIRGAWIHSSFSLSQDPLRESPFPAGRRPSPVPSPGPLELQRTREEKLSMHPAPNIPGA
jgi:hypothetical protein